MHVVNLLAALGTFDEAWSPRIVGELNGQHVKVARLSGEFVWHHHEDEDELFLVLTGSLRMLLRGGGSRGGGRGSDDATDFEPGFHEFVIGTGEFLIVPRGVEHLPIADEECQVLLFEPAGTRNTGSVNDPRTVESPGRL